MPHMLNGPHPHRTLTEPWHVEPLASLRPAARKAPTCSTAREQPTGSAGSGLSVPVQAVPMDSLARRSSGEHRASVRVALFAKRARFNGTETTRCSHR